MTKIIFALMLLMPFTVFAETFVQTQYIKEAGNTSAISPTNITTVSAGVDKYSDLFNVQYSDFQSFSIKIDAGSATSFSVSVEAREVDADGTVYYESLSPANSFSFTGDTEKKYALSLPVGAVFRFKFTADAAAAYEVERLAVHRK